jgi:hypothetical protein
MNNLEKDWETEDKNLLGFMSIIWLVDLKRYERFLMVIA